MDSSYTPSSASDNAGLRKWFLRALIASVVIHVVLLVTFHVNKLERFNVEERTARLSPRPFTVKQVHLDPKIFETEVEPQASAHKPQTAAPQQVLQPERPDLAEIPDKVTLTPGPTDPIPPLVDEKPAAISGALPKVDQPQMNAEIERELNTLRERAGSENAPKIAPSADLSREAAAQGGERTDDIPGFSTLDDLLARSGPLSGPVAPVAMPGGALFDYDSAELHAASVATLSKLGELIRRNPHATFSLEGHSDSFGDPAYNRELSLRRADAVKAWLIQNMQVDPSRIATRGFGSERLIAPATGTPEEQQVNRRVEIVIKTPSP
ncbi:MAG TPA: OmpA family protein [Chthoniobacteraceae bacterium]|nr:OmpA family protein [Chthoniobacteraceae bacterium]